MRKMVSWLKGSLSSLSVAAAAVVLAAGCGVAPGAGDATEGVGTVQVALDAAGPGGVVYHLANASFLIDGPSTITLSGDTPTVTTDLAPGSYTIQLLDGFSVEEQDPDGTSHAVTAMVTSPNPQLFAVRSQRTTSVNFSIRIGEVIVTTGNGTVAVTASIDDTLIDDFEDGDDEIALLAARNGTWFTFNDGTGTQTPAPGTQVLPETDAQANFLLHTSGRGFAASSGGNFGAGVGTSLRNDPTTFTALPYDGSSYTGVRFTYSFNSTSFFVSGPRFNVETSATTPVQFGGTCTVNCSDDFGIQLLPTSGFTQTVTIPFAQLSQQGFGAPATFDPHTLIGIKWNFSFFIQPGDFDFTVDDIAFTR